MLSANILLAEDDEIMRITIHDRLREEGWKVDVAEDGRTALKLIRERNYHVLLSDIRMPGLAGDQLMAEVHRVSPETDVILMTAFGSVSQAVQCLKDGAVDYVLKPFDLEDIAIRIRRILEHRNVKARCAVLEESCAPARPAILGSSPKTVALLEMIDRIAPSDATVLIQGESGTGKELVAAAIHHRSRRAHGPYVRVNCPAIPEGLMESELFGHEKGAFTGATARKIGRFEQADGGTILLDEIADIPLALQAKLLRVLQERECERLGGTKTIRLNVRVICATAKDLNAERLRGAFREDLYFRLQVIPVEVAPLRERREDIFPLTEHFLKEFGEKSGRGFTLTPDAQQALLEYDYPGNVRELRNILERVCVLASGSTIGVSELPFAGGTEPARIPHPEIAGKNLAQKVAETERFCIREALSVAGGNRTRAAELLGISRKNLWEKMKQLDILA